MRSQVQLPDPVAAVFITKQLAGRSAEAPDFLREKLAIQDLAQVVTEYPSQVLPRLVKLGMEICGAESAGIASWSRKPRNSAGSRCPACSQTSKRPPRPGISALAASASISPSRS